MSHRAAWVKCIPNIEGSKGLVEGMRFGVFKETMRKEVCWKRCMAGEGQLSLERRGGSRSIWEDPVDYCIAFGF